MSKHDSYLYEKEGSKLSFSFEKDETNLTKKKIFLEVLKQAVEELEADIKKQEEMV